MTSETDPPPGIGARGICASYWEAEGKRWKSLSLPERMADFLLHLSDEQTQQLNSCLTKMELDRIEAVCLAPSTEEALEVYVKLVKQMRRKPSDLRDKIDFICEGYHDWKARVLYDTFGDFGPNW